MLRRKHEFLVALAVVAVVIVVAACFWVLSSRHIRYVSGPYDHEAYVWQRRWDEALMSGIDRAAPELDRLMILAAEVDWRDGRPDIVRTRIDYATLRGTGKPVGMVVRINPFPGPYRADDAIADALAQVIEAVVREARDEGIVLAELQIDVDSATAKLDGYGVWLSRFDRELGDVPLTITTLPAWLSSSRFKPLVQQTDGFVLQVHAIVRPSAAQSHVSLINPVHISRWVKQAARTDVPFRVAMPTYSYRAGFTAEGEYLGIVAEGPQPRWPDGFTAVDVHADARTASELVRGWETARPENMLGVVWFRLPIDSDSRNWRWPTLQHVISGEKPAVDIAAHVVTDADGTQIVELTNRGTGELLLGEAVVELRWTGAAPTQAQAIYPFAMGEEEQAVTVLLVEPVESGEKLRANERLAVARLRFSREANLRASFKRLGQ